MGNKSSSIQSLLHFDIQRLLLLYSLVCDTFDQNLGRLKIYRKKQFNYDYIALADKLIEKQLIEDCKSIINLCYEQRRRGLEHSRDLQKKFKILQNADLWLKVYSCEIMKDVKATQSLIPLKICFEYLNFTLKEYVQKNSIGLLMGSEGRHNRMVLPRNLAYVLGCVLQAYNQLRNLHETHPSLNILSMVVSITTPSLIYINVDKCIKFLPLPLFIFSDNFSRMDQCMMHCCKFANEDQKNFRSNIIVPKYGLAGNGEQGIQKIDKLFMTKFKKMVKYIHNETAFTIQSRKSQDGSQAITTHPQENKYNNHLTLSNHGRQKLLGEQLKNIKNNEQQYWDFIENANSIEEIVKFVKRKDVFPENLDFSGNSDVFMETSKRKNQFNKDEKIKLEKYNKHRNSVNLRSHLNIHPQTSKNTKNVPWQVNDVKNQLGKNLKEYSLKSKVSYSLTQNKLSCNRMTNNGSYINGVKVGSNNGSHCISQSYDYRDQNNLSGRNKLQTILQTSGIKYQSTRMVEQDNRWNRCIGVSLL